MSSSDIVNFGVPWESDYGYCQARRVGEMVFVSGQLSHDDKGKFIGTGDFEKQARQTYDNITKILRKLGASLDNVVFETVYITDMKSQSATLSKVHKEYFPKCQVTSTSVEISRLSFKEQMIEVNAIAIAPQKK